MIAPFGWRTAMVSALFSSRRCSASAGVIAGDTSTPIDPALGEGRQPAPVGLAGDAPPCMGVSHEVTPDLVVAIPDAVRGH